MYFPDEAAPVETQILKGAALGSVGPGDLWLASYGKKLFIASKPKGRHEKVLFEADLQSDL